MLGVEKAFASMKAKIENGQVPKIMCTSKVITALFTREKKEMGTGIGNT